MEPPPSLPARLYLLVYDLEKKRMARYSHLGNLLCAAALTDLFLDGRIADAGGRARPADAPDRAAVADPVLADLLERVTASRPRTWKHWVGKGSRSTKPAVRDQLEADRLIRVERRRLLGVIPADRVTVPDTRVVRQLARQAGQALSGATPLTRVEPRDAALVALAAAGELGTVANRRMRREHKDRISKLSLIAGPAVPALRAVLRDEAAAAAAAVT